MRTRTFGAALLMLALFAGTPRADAPQASPAMEVATQELNRVMSSLQGREDAPYHLAYEIVDTQQVRLSATYGVLAANEDDHYRSADIDVRVGSPELDNTHKIRDASWWSEESRHQVRLPIDDDPYAIRMMLWRETDDAWRAAVRRLTKVRANEAVKVAREDRSADFSPAPVAVDIRPPVPLTVDREAWAATLREVSAIFKEHPVVIDSRVELLAESELRMFTSSEGTRVQEPATRYRVSIAAFGVADDGMELQVYDYVDAHTIEGLPGREELLTRAAAAADYLERLHDAPVLDPFTGPAILRGRAAGVFFHEVFGHRAEGHRQKDEDEGQTFTDMVGKSILPPFLSVVDDPSQERLGAVDLNGYYHYDDEGVAGQRVNLVDGGILRNFLLSRMPITGFSSSNGHGRRQPGNLVVPRQGNLMVQASQTVPFAELRRQLLEQIKKQGRSFGIIVDDITGGFTLTGRITPNAFNVRPVALWKVYPDGRPDELARGGDLIGTPLTTFARILAAGDDPDVFNGVCGAESGWVPVSAVAPSLLIQEIEVQRKEKSNDRPPLLDAPEAK